MLFERNNQEQDDSGKLDKMQVWIEIRDSVSAMLRAGENPVEVMPHIEGGGGIMKFRHHRIKKLTLVFKDPMLIFHLIFLYVGTALVPGTSPL